jgi:hypothetical protein
VLEAQATPPDRFASRQRVGDEINAHEVLFVRYQSFGEFQRVRHSRLRRELES